MSSGHDPLFDPSELNVLICKVQDNDAKRDELVRLNDLLSRDPAARSYYLRRTMLATLLSESSRRWNATGTAHADRIAFQDAGLEDDPPAASLHDAMVLPALADAEENLHTDAAVAPPPNAPPPAARPRNSWRWRAGLAIAATLLLAVTLVLVRQSAAPAPVVLSAAVAADWEGPGIPNQAGAMVPGVELTLTSGLIELSFPRGARAVIEGPARFRIGASNQISLSHGKVSAEIPPQARGFSVITPAATIMDLGTAFGTSVDENGSAYVQVFKGRVSLSANASRFDASAPAITVEAGSARRIVPGAVPSDAAFEKDAFVRPDDFEAQVSARATTPLERWRAFSRSLVQDPDLVAYFPFDNGAKSPERLANRSSAGSALDGILGGADPAAMPSWTTGRWRGKGALAFDPQTPQHVALPATPALDFSRGTATASPFTILVWVKAGPPTAPSEQTGIISLGPGFAEQYALDVFGGRFRAFVRQTELIRTAPAVETAAGPDLRWHLLASVYDPARAKLALYVDGKLSAETGAPRLLLPVSDGINIGSRQTDGIAFDATLNGLIDELAIYRRPLTPQEILRWHEAGKPD